MYSVIMRSESFILKQVQDRIEERRGRVTGICANGRRLNWSRAI